MPLYVVRTTQLRAFLVSARNDEDLQHVLAELTDPALCTWRPYDGPIGFELYLPVNVEVAPGDGPVTCADVDVGDVGALALLGAVPKVAPGRQAQAMLQGILRRAFPHVWGSLRYPRRNGTRQLRDGVALEVLREELLMDRAEGLAEPEAPSGAESAAAEELAAALGTSVEVARRYVEEAACRAGLETPEPAAGTPDPEADADARWDQFQAVRLVTEWINERAPGEQDRLDLLDLADLVRRAFQTVRGQAPRLAEAA